MSQIVKVFSQLNLQKEHLCCVNESGETNYCYPLLLTTETTW